MKNPPSSAASASFPTVIPLPTAVASYTVPPVAAAAAACAPPLSPATTAAGADGAAPLRSLYRQGSGVGCCQCTGCGGLQLQPCCRQQHNEWRGTNRLAANGAHVGLQRSSRHLGGVLTELNTAQLNSTRLDSTWPDSTQLNLNQLSSTPSHFAKLE